MNTQFDKSATMREAGEHWGPRNTAGVTIASSIRFEDVCYGYGANQVLHSVTLKVEPGEILCLLGPSGSGKTTLLRIAAGLEKPDSGTVLIDERVVDDENTHVLPEKRNVGLVFQDFSLFPHLTVLQNVMFGLTELGKAEARNHALRILNRVGMGRYADVYPHEISGGEQQRVALARAMAPRPRILLMDEPFSGLDSHLRDSIRDETVDLLRDTRSTTIIVTHDPEEALRLGDHIALMRNGRLVQYGAGDELYKKPKSLFSAQFFSELNVFSVNVEGGMLKTPIGSVSAGDIEEGGRADVCARISDIAVKSVPSSGASGIPAQVRSRRFMGVVELLELGIGGETEPVRLRIKAGTLEPDLQQVQISIDPEKMMVFRQVTGS